MRRTPRPALFCRRRKCNGTAAKQKLQTLLRRLNPHSHKAAGETAAASLQGHISLKCTPSARYGFASRSAGRFACNVREATWLPCAGAALRGSCPARELPCAGAALGGSCPGRELPCAGAALRGSCPGRELPCAGAALGGSCPGRELPWAGAALRGSCPGRELPWAEAALRGSCPARELPWAGAALGGHQRLAGMAI
jgi:hypothetical protein